MFSTRNPNTLKKQSIQKKKRFEFIIFCFNFKKPKTAQALSRPPKNDDERKNFHKTYTAGLKASPVFPSRGGKRCFTHKAKGNPY
jgi:hypothetical protein